MFSQLADRAMRVLEFTLVMCLWVMVIMVLGNVILRYGFNSGITVSEELSRFLFVWLTFLGAIVAMREGAHLGLDTLVRKLPLNGKKVCLVLSECLILMCCVFMFYGTWRQHHINLTNAAPITALPMIYVYGVGYITSVGIGLIVLNKLWRLATGRLSADELIEVADSEEHIPPAAVGSRP